MIISFSVANITVTPSKNGNEHLKHIYYKAYCSRDRWISIKVFSICLHAMPVVVARPLAIRSTAAHHFIGVQRRGPTLRHIPLWRVQVLHFFP
jgi:hypothetical protein